MRRSVADLKCVCDMNGSVSEYTENIVAHGEGVEYYSYRGGNFRSPDEYYFRLATRNGLSMSGDHEYMGVRLVAYHASSD